MSAKIQKTMNKLIKYFRPKSNIKKIEPVDFLSNLEEYSPLFGANKKEFDTAIFGAMTKVAPLALFFLTSHILAHVSDKDAFFATLNDIKSKETTHQSGPYIEP